MRVVSGIRPSGIITIANYLGAIKQWLALQEENETYFFIADLHAITTPYDPKTLRETVLDTAAIYLACGIDPKKTVLFLQSFVPEHVELSWLLQTITPVGELQRMTQYKEKVKEEKAPAFSGLLSYPVLMAADILLYKAEVVPVGEDQKQHLELARSIAERFNKKFGETFPLPKTLLPSRGAERIKSLRDPSKKMSKSHEPESYLSLTDSPDDIRRKIKTALTDSGKDIVYNPAKKPAISNLLVIASAISGKSIAMLEKEFSGKGYAVFKSALAEMVIETLKPIQSRIKSYRQDPAALKEILKEGSERAGFFASRTLAEAKEKMGLML